MFECSKFFKPCGVYQFRRGLRGVDLIRSANQIPLFVGSASEKSLPFVEKAKGILYSFDLLIIFSLCKA